MANFSERIVKLEQRLNKINQRLIKVSEELQKNQNFSEIKAKEKELIELNQSLSTSQSEKEKILKDLNAEIAKVKNSNLSNEEKSKQIIALTTNNQQERTEIFNNLSQAWWSYHEIQQKIIEVLENKNQDEFKKAIAKSDQTNQRNFTIKITLLAIIIFFLLIPYLKKGKKLIKKQYDKL